MLVDGLPRAVKIGGEDVPINTDFRTGILFEEAIRDAELTGEEKLITMIQLYYPQIDMITAETLEAAVDKAIWFYRCGHGPEPAAAGEGEPSEPAFSYEYDAPYIYAAFVQAYGIDLTHEQLHWWQFIALFNGLPEDTKISKIIGYRVTKIPAKASKEQKEHLRRMKRLYALPESFKQTQNEADLTEILMKGGNPEEILNKGRR